MSAEEAVALRYIRRALRQLLGVRLHDAAASQSQESAAAAAAGENSPAKAQAAPGATASAAR